MSNDIIKNIIKEIPHEHYIERHERWLMPESMGGKPINMISGYSHKGDYIGRLEDAQYLCDKLGIIPEVASPDLTVCTIGFCPKENKWYGWSHRAKLAFGIGDTPKISTPFEEENNRIDKTPIKSLEEAKQAAIRFAESVASADMLRKVEVDHEGRRWGFVSLAAIHD